MYTLYALWSKPRDEDIDAFEEHYLSTHAPLAAAVPNIRALVTARTPEGLEGGEPAFYRIALMKFDTKEEFEEAEHADAWRTLREDAGVLIERFNVTLEVSIGVEEAHDVAGGA